MNTPRWFLFCILASLCTMAPGCRRPGAQTVGIPDGEYRDVGGLVLLSLQENGRKAVLETTLLGAPLRVSGPPVLLDGQFYITDIADTLHFRLFTRRVWTWKTDHFVLKERDPPGRTFELRRK